MVVSAWAPPPRRPFLLPLYTPLRRRALGWRFSLCSLPFPAPATSCYTYLLHHTDSSMYHLHFTIVPSCLLLPTSTTSPLLSGVPTLVPFLLHASLVGHHFHGPVCTSHGRRAGLYVLTYMLTPLTLPFCPSLSGHSLHVSLPALLMYLCLLRTRTSGWRGGGSPRLLAPPPSLTTAASCLSHLLHMPFPLLSPHSGSWHGVHLPPPTATSLGRHGTATWKSFSQYHAASCLPGQRFGTPSLAYVS